MSTPSTPTSTPTTLPSRRGENRRFDGKSWFSIGHTANSRRSSHISAIWDHGNEYIDLLRPESHQLTWWRVFSYDHTSCLIQYCNRYSREALLLIEGPGSVIVQQRQKAELAYSGWQLAIHGGAAEPGGVRRRLRGVVSQFGGQESETETGSRLLTTLFGALSWLLLKLCLLQILWWTCFLPRA